MENVFLSKNSFCSQNVKICPDVFVNMGKQLGLISKFMSHNLRNKQLQYRYCPTAQEAKAINQ